MPTPFSTIIASARTLLNEASASFWADTELLGYAIDGARDLWRAIVNLNQGHFVAVEATGNIVYGANTNWISGLPADLYRIESLELLDLTAANPVQNCTFEFRRVSDAEFQSSRSLSPQDPNGQQLFFHLYNAGAPVGTPLIEVAPQITTPVALRMVYTQTLPAANYTVKSINPVPGDSDHALMCWVIAHALARERDDLTPHPTWIAMYASDKNGLLESLTPRQTQDVETADAIFESWSW